MIDFDPSARILREDLLQMLRGRVPDAVPDSRLIAEGILGAESRIDFVAVEPSGRLTVLVVSDAGEELAAIGRAIAHRAWVEARLPDWLQLSPQLEATSQAGVGAAVICTSFSDDARVAAAALGESILRLVRYHFVRNGSGLEVLIEKALPLAVNPSDRVYSLTSARTSGAEIEPVFRTGLTDADLGIPGGGRSEFE